MTWGDVRLIAFGFIIGACIFALFAMGGCASQPDLIEAKEPVFHEYDTLEHRLA